MDDLKNRALDNFDTALTDFFHHDRKECEDVNMYDMQYLLDTDTLTVDDLKEALESFMLKHYGK